MLCVQMRNTYWVEVVFSYGRQLHMCSICKPGSNKNCGVVQACVYYLEWDVQKSLGFQHI